MIRFHPVTRVPYLGGPAVPDTLPRSRQGAKELADRLNRESADCRAARERAHRSRLEQIAEWTRKAAAGVGSLARLHFGRIYEARNRPAGDQADTMPAPRTDRPRSFNGLARRYYDQETGTPDAGLIGSTSRGGAR